MSDEKTIAAVAAALTGHFYIEQRVQHMYTLSKGTVVDIDQRPGRWVHVHVKFDSDANALMADRVITYAEWALAPL